MDTQKIHSWRRCQNCKLWVAHSEEETGIYCNCCLVFTKRDKNNKFKVPGSRSEECFSPKTYTRKAESNNYFSNRKFEREDKV